MILNEELFQKRCRQRKSYLVYLLNSCEMGSEGFSGWSYYELAKNELPRTVYGESQPLYVQECYRKHLD